MSTSQTQPQTTNLAEYTPQMLDQIRQGMTQELEFLTAQLGNFKLALSKYQAADKSLTGVKAAQNAKKDVMIPLTTSMYVAGVMENVDKVTIDIGTGYFVEKTIEQAEEFFKKKIETVTKSIDQVQNVIISKREELVMVNKVLQVKQQDALAQAQQAALGKLDSLQRPSTSK